jgi:hypothetical protein
MREMTGEDGEMMRERRNDMGNDEGNRALGQCGPDVAGNLRHKQEEFITFYFAIRKPFPCKHSPMKMRILSMVTQESSAIFAFHFLPMGVPRIGGKLKGQRPGKPIEGPKARKAPAQPIGLGCGR